jgi:hypothetical protein
LINNLTNHGFSNNGISARRGYIQNRFFGMYIAYFLKGKPVVIKKEISEA